MVSRIAMGTTGDYATLAFVLSSDSDFAVLPSAGWLPIDALFVSPHGVCGRVFDSTAYAQSLFNTRGGPQLFRSWRLDGWRMHVFAAVFGNDLTKHSPSLAAGFHHGRVTPSDRQQAAAQFVALAASQEAALTSLASMVDEDTLRAIVEACNDLACEPGFVIERMRKYRYQQEVYLTKDKCQVGLVTDGICTRSVVGDRLMAVAL